MQPNLIGHVKHTERRACCFYLEAVPAGQHHDLDIRYKRPPAWEPPRSSLLLRMQQDCEQLDAGSSFALLGLSGAQLLWHAGFLAVPLALFFVGTAQYDVLHAPYLLLLLGYLARPALHLVPSARMALIPFRQVRSPAAGSDDCPATSLHS